MATPTAGTGAEQDQYWPLPKFYFSVDIGEYTDLPFQEVSGLDIETEAIEYRHGNSPAMSAIKMPGMFKFSDVTLKKGVFSTDNDFYDWISTISLNTFRRVHVTAGAPFSSNSLITTVTLSNVFSEMVEIQS